MRAKHKCWNCGHTWKDKSGPTAGCPLCKCLYSTWTNIAKFWDIIGKK